MKDLSQNIELLVDPARQRFKVPRASFVDPDVVAAERQAIFDRCWLYLGHASEIAAPGQFVTRTVAAGA